jgi:hypothetical protein
MQRSHIDHLSQSKSKRHRTIEYPIPPEITLHILSYFELIFQKALYISYIPAQLVKLFYGLIDRRIVLLFPHISLGVDDADLVKRYFGNYRISSQIPRLITSLDVSKCPSRILEEMPIFINLTCLYARHCTIPHHVLSLLSKLDTSLRTLDLSGSELIGSDMHSQFYTKLSLLETFRTASQRLISFDDVKSIISSTRNLKHFSVDYHCIGFRDQNQYSLSFSDHPSLRSLDMHCHTAHKLSLTITPNTMLRELRLTDIIVSDDTAKWIFTNQLESLFFRQTLTYESDFYEEYDGSPVSPIHVPLNSLSRNTSLTKLEMQVNNGTFYDSMLHELENRVSPWHTLYIEEGIDVKNTLQVFKKNVALSAHLTVLTLSTFSDIDQLLNEILGKARHLRSLTLKDCGINDPTLIVQSTGLVELHLIACDIASSDFIPALCTLSLKCLTVEDVEITHKDILAIASSSLERFTTDHRLNEIDLAKLLLHSGLSELIVKDNCTSDDIITMIKTTKVSVLGMQADLQGKWKQLYLQDASLQQVILY